MVEVKNRIAEFRFFRRAARCVSLVGDFNRWQPDELVMRRDGDGYWRARLELPEGEYTFRYRADSQWFTDYAAFGVENSPAGMLSVLRIS